MHFPFTGILLWLGFWLMDREICTSISGRKGCPRELMLTLAYLTGQDWEASISGHAEKEGTWKRRAGVPPGMSSRSGLQTLHCSRSCRHLRCRRY